MELIKDTLNLSEWMNEPEPDHRVLPMSHWTEEVKEHFYAPRQAPQVTLGWRKAQDIFEFRPGEVSLWGGVNGSGKSPLHSQVTLDLMMQNQKVCIASLEMKPRKLMGRMLKQASGQKRPPLDFFNRFGKWSDGRLWVYDHFGSSNPSTMLAVIRYAIDKFGINHFVCDNLTTVIEKEDDYNEQKRFISGLCTIARDTDIHIHLVAHTRKGRSEADLPNKYDVRGTGAIVDLVDNLFLVWRNKKKEDAVQAGEDFDPNEHDAILILDKQRHSEGERSEGKFGFYFDTASNQYLEDRLALPRPYDIGNEVDIEEVEF